MRVAGRRLVGRLAPAADPVPSVPAQAADADRLVNQLGSKESREAADQALLALGRPALKALRRGVQGDNPDVRRRSRVLIELIDADAIALRELGGEVEVDDKLPEEPVIGVSLAGSQIAEAADLVRVEKFAVLTRLHIFGRRAKEAGITHLTGLKHLTSLGLSNVRLTDADLAALESMKGLTELSLSDTRITDDGLKRVGTLKNLWGGGGGGGWGGGGRGGGKAVSAGGGRITESPRWGGAPWTRMRANNNLASNGADFRRNALPSAVLGRGRGAR